MKNATRRTDIGDLKAATQQYECLRVNALGEINRAPKLTLFLRKGMSAWLRTLGEPEDGSRTVRRQPSGDFTNTDADVPGAAWVSILTDAILNITVPDGRFGGRR